MADYIQSHQPRGGSAAGPGIRTPLDEHLAGAGALLSHVDVLGMLARSGTLTEATFNRYLGTLHAARRMDLLEAAVTAEHLGFDDTRLIFRLKLELYRGRTDTSAAELEGHYAVLSASRLHAEQAADLVAVNLARLEDASALARFLRRLTTQDLRRLAPATVLGCFRLLDAGGDRELADRLRDSSLAPLSRERRLYFLAIERDGPDSLRGAPWRQVLEAFDAAYSAADNADRETFTRVVLEPLGRLPQGTADFMNIRFDPRERNRFMDIIRDRIASRAPLGLLRLGDGEAYGYSAPSIPGIEAATFESDARVRERMWWGAAVPAAVAERLRADFRAAVAEADIVGVPSIYRIIRDRGTPHTRFGSNSAQRGLATVLAELGSTIPIQGKIVTEERCHQILFDRAAIGELMALARRVVIVSCWTPGQLDLPPHDQLASIVVPAHSRVAGDAGAGGALFETFEAQMADMEPMCDPGTLVLVGAGFLGKVFIARARAKGAVALDVGVMLDYFAGFKTRSLADLG